MTTLMMRPFTGEGDLRRLADLINYCDAVDRFDEGQSLEDLRAEIDEPGFDKDRDLRLWEDGDGRIVGVGFVYLPSQGEALDGGLWLKVHPDARGGDLEREILAWGESRVREAGRERGKPAQARAQARAEDTERLALLEAQGYTRARFFFRMRRPLDQPIGAPRFPEGITLRHVAGPDEAEEWTACYNESFVDHWNHHPLTVERRLHWSRYPSYKSERDLIAVDPDGRFAGFCLCTIDADENRRVGRSDGWINILGTRRGFRKIGLGRALLLAGLHLLKGEGVDTAVLGVDADNPNRALQLYESAGFHVAFQTIAFVKDV